MSARRARLARCLAVCLACGALIGGAAACAGRETQASRAAWQRAVESGNPATGGGGGTSQGRGGGALADPSAWRDLHKFTVDAAELVALGVSTAPLDALIDKLCAEPPEEDPAVIEPEAVRCQPKPAMDPLGHPLMLELGRRGTIGLVATELSSADSEALVALALEQMAGACSGPWTRIPSIPTEEFHTCMAPSGSTLVLGRFLGHPPGQAQSESWQFSLAVLGPG